MTAPKKYQKKPVINEAMQWTGDNTAAMQAWVGTADRPGDDVDGSEPGFYVSTSRKGYRDKNPAASLWVAANRSWLPVTIGEWVIKDASGFYPCLNERFIETYGDVTEPAGPAYDPVVSMKLEHDHYGAVTVQVLADAPVVPLDTALWALTVAAQPDFALKMWNAAHPEDDAATIEQMMALQAMWTSKHLPVAFAPIEVTELDGADDDEA